MKEYLHRTNNWWNTGKLPQAYENTTLREKTADVEKFMDDREILILLGPRRAGKTTIMFQLIDSLLKKGAKPLNILYFSLDDPEITLYLKEDLFIKLFDSYQEILAKELVDEELYIFIDEVQFFDGWELWLKKYFDQYPNIKFVVSGSSSLAIKDESAALTGRNLKFLIYPFSFREYLSARENIQVEKIQFEFEKFEISYNTFLPQKNKMKLLFLDYLQGGGYPRLLYEEKSRSKEILKQYFSDTIYKDILKTYAVRDIRALESIAAYLAQNVGQRFSFRKISSALEINLETVIHYVKYLEEAYLIFMVNYFSYSSKAIMQKEKKVYMIDTGLKNAISNPDDEPVLVENVVFTHLTRRFDNVSYWRDGVEVDFVVTLDNVPLPIEVKYQNSIGKSDVKSVLRFCERFKVNTGLMVTKDDFKRETIEGIDVWFIPVWLFITLI
ncbi:MAG: AAA family ATPase [Methanosarcinaceae archaeon]|nr:AAA family ATPase [Methanosarcinaceae archaeon]